MLIQARFPSTCAACRREILVGDRISYTRGSPALHAACSEEGKAMTAAVQVSRAPAPSAAVAALPSLPCPEGRDYLPYQTAGIHAGLAHLARTRGVLIADEMGLGKTIQAIGLVNALPDVRTVLIVCPASLKRNWRKELRGWLTRHELTFGISGQKIRVAGQRKWIVGQFAIEITNYQSLTKLSKDATWDLLVLDEAHYVKNPESTRSKHVKALRKRARYCAALTGTPVLNKPLELFPLLQLVCASEWDPKSSYWSKKHGKTVTNEEGEGGGFFPFAKRYCGAKQILVPCKGSSFGKTVWTFDGSSNLEELQERLRTTCMVRRLKADVLTELPPKRRVVVPIAGDDNDEPEWDLGDDFEEAHRRLRKIPFSELSKARHAQALQKLEPATLHIQNALEAAPDEKIIVFAHHIDVLQGLAEGLKDFGVVHVFGSDSLDARDRAVESFQNDPSARVFVGSLMAAGVGLTLTASSHVVFVEGSWVPADETQAEDRAHRIGQKKSVLVEKLVVEGSIDERMAKFVTEKQEIADMALDAETVVDVSDRSVVNDAERSAADPTVNPTPIPLISAEEIARVHAQLRFLALRCDGASREDGNGYNKIDSNFGKSLAALPKLSPRQAVAAKKMLTKYQRQLSLMQEAS